MTHSRWKFHKAGQGCFYSGIIKTKGGAYFSFVYDCGSKLGSSMLRDEIQEFQNELAHSCNSNLNLLVLSHLDADHVNQVVHLLNKKIACDRVVLPYLPLIERLYLYFSCGFNDSTNADDYLSFVIDPATFLIERGVDNIIFVDGNEEGFNGRTDDISPEGPINTQDFRSEGQIIKLESIVQLAEVTLSSPSDNSDLMRLMGMSNVQFYKAGNTINASTYWEFYFYNKKQPFRKIVDFRKLVERVFSISVGAGGLTNDQALTILKNTKGRSKIRMIFEKVFGDCNSTGLIVLHGPIHLNWSRLYYDHTFTIPRWKDAYTLLNGDIFLRKVDYPMYIKTQMPKTRFYQVPHHGAEANWDAATLASLNETCMVINYGVGNSYGHPMKVVVNDILINCWRWKFIRNTQAADFCYSIYTYYIK